MMLQKAGRQIDPREFTVEAYIFMIVMHMYDGLEPMVDNVPCAPVNIGHHRVHVITVCQ